MTNRVSKTMSDKGAQMGLRPYLHAKDYSCLRSWISDERLHALWCANLIPYPLTADGLKSVLDKDAEAWGSNAYTVTRGDGEAVGFFVYSIQSGTGFLKFVILAPELRGRGLGTQMMKLALCHAYKGTGAARVRLNVFDVNEGARRCYAKAGFIEDGTELNVFPYKEERWGRCHMVAVRN